MKRRMLVSNNSWIAMVVSQGQTKGCTVNLTMGVMLIEMMERCTDLWMMRIIILQRVNRWVKFPLILAEGTNILFIQFLIRMIECLRNMLLRFQFPNLINQIMCGGRKSMKHPKESHVRQLKHFGVR